jgi:nicotinate dehydrogenase subunit B
VALIADVTVDAKTGAVRVERVVAAQRGVVVNPVGAQMQMEGCITPRLGYTLTEELRFADGEILDANFETHELPRIETVQVNNDAVDPQGAASRRSCRSEARSPMRRSTRPASASTACR